MAPTTPAKTLTHPMTRCSAGPLSATVCLRALGAYRTQAHAERSAPSDGTQLSKSTYSFRPRAGRLYHRHLTGSRSPLDLEGCDNRCPRRLWENEQRVWQMCVWRVSSSAESLVVAAFSMNLPCLKHQHLAGDQGLMMVTTDQ